MITNIKILLTVILLILTAYCLMMSIGLNLDGLNYKFAIENKYVIATLMLGFIDFFLLKNIIGAKSN